MYVEFRFCPVCGTYLEKNFTDPRSLPTCPLGHFTLYPNLANLAVPQVIRAVRYTNIFVSRNEETADTPISESDRFDKQSSDVWFDLPG